jgi:hypothetical protein
MSVALPLTLLFAACATGADAPASCESQTPGPARDTCLYEEIATLGAPQVARVTDAARRIHDPMIRGAAVSRWAADHAAALRPSDGEQLCGLLVGMDRSTCLRRLSSPHLQR